MAKLNGVTTVDMVNGEITKVAYNGTEYVSVKGNAEHGDLGLRIDNDCYYAKVGEFYPIIKDNGGQLCFKDDVGHEPYIKRQNFELFRKQSSQVTPTIESVDAKVDELANRVSALEEPQAESLKVGEYAKVVGGSTEIQNLAEGDIVEIRETAGFYDFKVFRVTDDEDELFNRGDLVRATDEEVASAKAQAEADATERKRTAVFTDAGRKPGKLRVGDIVRVKNSCGAGGGISNGDIIEVTQDSTEHSATVGRHWSVYAEIVTFAENRLDRN